MFGIKTQLDINSIKLCRQEFEKHLKNMQDLANKNVIKIKMDNVNSQLNDTRKSFEGINQQTKSFTDNMGYAIKRVSQFALGVSIVYGAVRELKSGLQEISNLNKSNVNIAMITGESVENIERMNKSWLEMSKNLKVVMSETVDAQEEFLRAGDSIEEANKDVETNIKLARISGQSNKEVADSLIILKNAYNLNSDELQKTASKIALLDNQSATSSAKINSAMSYTAQTAKEMGVSMDFLLGTLTTNLERSKQGGEAIGRAWKSIFLNMQKLQEGEDIEGLSKLEDALNTQGIALRKNEKEWRNGELVLKDLQKSWSEFDDITKSNIINLMAGKNQSEQFQIAMNESTRVLELENKVKHDSNSLNEAYEKHLDSIDAKMANLKNTATGFWMHLIDSNTIKSGIDVITNIIKGIDYLIVDNKLLGVSILALGGSLLIATKHMSGFKFAIGEVITFLSLLKTEGIAAFGALMIDPIILGFATVVGIATYKIIEHIKHQTQLKDQIDQLKTSYKSLTEAMKENNVNGMEGSTSDLKKKQDQYKELLKQRKELEDRSKDISKSDMDDMEKTTAQNIISKQLSDTNKKIEEQANAWEEAGYTINKATGEVQQLNQAQTLLENNKIANTIREQSQAEIDNRNEIIKLIQEYQGLDAIENKNAIQKERLSQLSEILTSKIGGLVVSKDKEGNVTIKNTDLLDKEIKMLNTEGATVETLTAVKLEHAKNNAVIEIGKTRTTYAEVKKRIEFYKEEMKALGDLKSSNGTTYDELSTKWNKDPSSLTKDEKILFDNMQRGGVAMGVRDSTNLYNLQKYIDEIDKIYASETKEIGKTTDLLNNDYIPANEKATKATDRNTIAINNSKNMIRDYENALKSLDNTIYKLETDMSNMDDTSQTYRDALSKEIKLLEQKNKTLNDGMTIAKNQMSVLSKMPKTSTTSTSSSSTSVKVGGGKNVTASQLDSMLGGVLKGHGADYLKYSQQYNVDPALAAAISISETGHGTSYAARVQNNPGGIMDWNNNWKTVKQFSSLEEGIKYQIKNLKDTYISQGLTSIEAIGSKYAPIGASNDPNNLNKNWIPTVTEYYNKMTGGTYKGSSSSSSSISSENSVETQIDSLKSKIEEYEKEKIDNTQKLEELKIAELNSQMKDYDKQISQTDLKISASKTNADLYNEGTQQKTQYLTEQWKAINERYALIAKKEQALGNAIKSGNYTEKTVADLKNQLAEIKNEELTTIKDLHDAFTEAYDAQYSSKVNEYKKSIEEIQWQLDNLDEKSVDAPKRKYELNRSLLEQQEQMKKKTLEQMKIVEEMLAKEKYDSTKQVWINQLDQLKESLREIEQSTEQITSNMESFLSNMQSSIESLQSNIVSALKAQYNDEIQALQEKINILQNDTPDKQNRLSALQKELKEWEKDDSQFSKNKQSELRSEIKKVNKELQIADLQSQIKQKQDESEDSKLNKEAIRIMKRGDTTEINNLLEEWLPEYKNKFDLFGDDYKTTIAEQTKKQLSEFKNFSSIAEDIRSKLYELNNESYSPNNTSSNSSSKVKRNEDGTIGTVSENDYGTKFVTYTYNGQERSVQAGSVFDPNSSNFIGYASGTTNARGGISMVGEEGAELRVLNQGDGIIPTNITETLMDFGKDPSNYISDYLRNFNLSNIMANIQLPNITLPDFSKLVPKTQINLDQPLVKNEITNYNNTPFDVENNMNNFERMLKQQVGSRLGLIG